MNSAYFPAKISLVVCVAFRVSNIFNKDAINLWTKYHQMNLSIERILGIMSGTLLNVNVANTDTGFSTWPSNKLPVSEIVYPPVDIERNMGNLIREYVVS